MAGMIRLGLARILVDVDLLCALYYRGWYDSAWFGSNSRASSVREVGGFLIGSSFVDKKLFYRISLSEAFFGERDLFGSPFLRSTRAHNLLFRRTYPLTVCRGATPHYIDESML
jgi:hypothetical protein